MDLQSKLVTAERDGLQKGLQQGRQEVAKSMKAIGIPASQISLVTGLTEQQMQAL